MRWSSRALNEPHSRLKERGAPLNTPVRRPRFLLLEQGARKLPEFPAADAQRRHHIVSLGNVVPLAGEQAKALGVKSSPGFAAAEVLFDDAGSVRASPPVTWAPAREASTAPTTPTGSSCSHVDGVLGRLPRPPQRAGRRRYGSNRSADPGSASQGTWEIDRRCINPVSRSTPWAGRSIPDTYGGSFLYHPKDNLVRWASWSARPQQPAPVALRGVPALQDPSGDPPHFEGGRRISTGAGALRRRLRSPPLACSGRRAGRRHRDPQRARIKGTHVDEIRIEAAEGVLPIWLMRRRRRFVGPTRSASRRAGCGDELCTARNVRPRSAEGPQSDVAKNAIDTFLLRGRAPRDAHREPRRPPQLRKAAGVPADRLSQARRQDQLRPGSPRCSSRPTNQRGAKPCHLRLKNAEVPIKTNLALYDAPRAARYCPAGVNESSRRPKGRDCRSTPRTACTARPATSRTLHQNIDWAVPEGRRSELPQHVMDAGPIV